MEGAKKKKDYTMKDGKKLGEKDYYGQFLNAELLEKGGYKQFCTELQGEDEGELHELLEKGGEIYKVFEKLNIKGKTLITDKETDFQMIKNELQSIPLEKFDFDMQVQFNKKLHELTEIDENYGFQKQADWEKAKLYEKIKATASASGQTIFSYGNEHFKHHPKNKDAPEGSVKGGLMDKDEIAECLAAVGMKPELCTEMNPEEIEQDYLRNKEIIKKLKIDLKEIDKILPVEIAKTFEQYKDEMWWSHEVYMREGGPDGFVQPFRSGANKVAEDPYTPIEYGVLAKYEGWDAIKWGQIKKDIKGTKVINGIGALLVLQGQEKGMFKQGFMTDDHHLEGYGQVISSGDLCGKTGEPEQKIYFYRGKYADDQRVISRPNGKKHSTVKGIEYTDSESDGGY